MYYLFTDAQPTLPFFIDTLGTREEHINSSESTMKMKNKNNIPVNSYCEVGIDGKNKVNKNIYLGTIALKQTDIPVNKPIIFKFSGKSKAIDSVDDAPTEVSNTSLKKKNKLKIVSLSVEEDATVEPETNDKSTDDLIKTPGTKKKKKKVKQDGKSGL